MADFAVANHDDNMVDLNGDGKLDLAVTAASGLSIFTGNGTISSPVNYPQYAGAASVAAGASTAKPRFETGCGF
jgi:FG-GAP repeat